MSTNRLFALDYHSVSLVSHQDVMKIKYKPLTVLRLIKLWPHARNKGRKIGQIYRVGYYLKQDGTELIWLVDDNGLPCRVIHNENI